MCAAGKNIYSILVSRVDIENRILIDSIYQIVPVCKVKASDLNKNIIDEHDLFYEYTYSKMPSGRNGTNGVPFKSKSTSKLRWCISALWIYVIHQSQLGNYFVLLCD